MPASLESAPEQTSNRHRGKSRGKAVYMGVSKNRDTPKWMVYNGNPYQNGWFGGTTIFGNTHIWLKDQHPKCSLAVRWQHESWTSGHHHWLPGTSYSNLSPLQDFGLGTEQELTFAAESIFHVWFPITIPNDRFLITQLQSHQKYLGHKFSFTWCFKQVQVLLEIIEITYLEESKQCKCMVNLKDFPLMVQQLPLPAVHLER